MTKTSIVLGSINAFLAVALGAFGAHGLKHVLSEAALQTWSTANQYHMYHSLGLLLIGILQLQKPHIPLQWPSRLMFMGICLFSGSLYLLAVSGIKLLGMITPLGGLCFLVGWAWLAYQWSRAQD